MTLYSEQSRWPRIFLWITVFYIYCPIGDLPTCEYTTGTENCKLWSCLVQYRSFAFRIAYRSVSAFWENLFNCWSKRCIWIVWISSRLINYSWMLLELFPILSPPVWRFMLSWPHKWPTIPAQEVGWTHNLIQDMPLDHQLVRHLSVVPSLVLQLVCPVEVPAQNLTGHPFLLAGTCFIHSIDLTLSLARTDLTMTPNSWERALWGKLLTIMPQW